MAGRNPLNSTRRSADRRPAARTKRRNAARRVANRRGREGIMLAAVRYLSARDRTEAQLRTYLTRLGAPLSRIRTLTTLFRARGYLDDAAFAARWAESRLARRPMGRARLEAELLRRGIDAATTRRTLEQVYRDLSERELAARLLARRLADHHRGGVARDAALLRRHGFSDETIEAVLSPETE